MHMSWELVGTRKQHLKNKKLYCSQMMLYKCFGTHLLGQEVIWVVLGGVLAK